MKAYLSRYISDKANQMIDKQALRYAITCTLATCLAGLIQYIFQFPFYAALFFILSSALSVYLSYGNNLLQQTLTTFVANAIITFCCLLAVILSPYFWPSLLFLLVVSFVGYFYSTINRGWFFMGKIGIALLSGIVVGINQNIIELAIALPIAIISGGSIAIVANGLLTLFSVEQSWKHHLNRWHSEFEKLLETLSNHNNATSSELIKQLNISKPLILDAQPDIGFLIDRITFSLAKYIQLINNQPYINDNFANELNRLFLASLKSLKDHDTSHINQTYDDFRKHVFKLRHQGYFKQLPISIRKYYVECFYILETFESDLLTYIQKDYRNKSTLPKVKWFSVSIRNIFQNLSKHPVLDDSNRLSINSKIAIRAAIAIPLAFVIAKIMNVEHASWVILSTNVVLLVRRGDTIKKAFDRVGGHFVGALLALVFGYFIWPYFFSPFFWVPLLILPTAYFYLKNYFIYAMMLMLGILYFYMGASPVNIDIEPFIFIRFFDVAFGSLLAMIAGLVIFPNVGIRPFPRAFKHIMRQYASYAVILKPTTTQHKEHHIRAIRRQIREQLEENQQLYHSLSFQPESYIYYQDLYKTMIQLQIDIFEHLESLTRRLHRRYNAAIHNTYLRYNIYKFLEKAAHNIASIARQLNPEPESLDSKYPTIDRSHVTQLKLDIDAAIESAFQQNDKSEINFDELVSYLGIIYIINQLNQILLEVSTPIELPSQLPVSKISATHMGG